MKMELFAIKDTMVGFSQPFPAVNEGVALRQFIGSAKAEQPNIVNTYPENKELWKLGVLDDQTGELNSDIKFIARASVYTEVKNAEKDSPGTAEQKDGD